MEIKEIKNLCKDEFIEVTEHFAERCRKRNITYREAKETIFNGEIIENYSDDYPFPSCLILGTTSKGKKLHVVAGLGNNKLWLITVYEPDRCIWDESFRFRKE